MPGGSKYMRHPNNGLGPPQEVSARSDACPERVPFLLLPPLPISLLVVRSVALSQIIRIPSWIK